MRTNTNRLFAGVLIAGMVLASTGISYAANIGTGSVVGSGALSSNVVWNDVFPGTATGTINGLTVRATVKPALNMVISGSGIINLGNLDPAGYSTGSVDIEIGTNAANGSSVTARSTNGGLLSSSDNTQYIRSTTSTNDSITESYRYSSSILAATDSSFTSFSQSGMSVTEVNNSTTAHPIYTSNKPQALSATVNDFTFTITAKPDAQTPAGQYNDIVVMTVTGNF